MAHDDVGVAHVGVGRELVCDFLRAAVRAGLGAEAAVAGGDDRLCDSCRVRGVGADVDVAADGDGCRGSPVACARFAIGRGLLACLVGDDVGIGEPTVAHARGTVDGRRRGGTDPHLDGIGRDRRDPSRMNLVRALGSHRSTGEQLSHDVEPRLESGHARAQRCPHRRELSVAAADGALEDEASARDRGERADLLGHRDRVPQR